VAVCVVHLKPSEGWQYGSFSKSKPAEELTLEDHTLAIETMRVGGLTMCFEHRFVVSILISTSYNGTLGHKVVSPVSLFIIIFLSTVPTKGITVQADHSLD